MSTHNSIHSNSEIGGKLKKINTLESEIRTYYSLPGHQLSEVRKKFITNVFFHTFLGDKTGFSLKELEDLVGSDKVRGDKPFSEYIKLYRKIRALFFLEKEGNDQDHHLSLQLIQKLYFLLFLGEDIIEDGSFALPYRDSMALVDEGQNSFTLLPVSEIPYQLEKLIAEYLEKKGQHHPLLLSAEFQHRFIQISPFQKGNLELSFYILEYLIMAEGIPPIILKQINREDYISALEKGSKDQFISLYNNILDEAIVSLDYLLSLYKELHNKGRISSAGYFSSLVKEIQSTEKEVIRFKTQKRVDEEAIKETLSKIEELSRHYFLNYSFGDMSISSKQISIRDVMHPDLLRNYFTNDINRPLWKTIEGYEKRKRIYLDTLDSVLEVQLASEHLYIPNSILYFGVMPTREGNYIYSVLTSTYLDFRKEERFPKNLSFFRSVKGGIQLKDWEEGAINKFFNESMDEFFDQLAEKVTERKRILKNAY